jgi:protein-tyrosine phosphatase
MKIVLFLCSGNYYRSRFAEIYFNHLAQEKKLPWRAESRGLALQLGANNVGPISPNALDGLYRRGITAISLRTPQRVKKIDFKRADRIIALKEDEHRHYIASNFSQWENKVEYWDIHDLGGMKSFAALRLLDRKIRLLVKNLNELT